TRRPCAAYRPSGPVVVILVVPDGSCTICTVAPATGWPLASSTRPLIEEEVSWASAGTVAVASREAIASGRTLARIRLFMMFPSSSRRNFLRMKPNRTPPGSPGGRTRGFPSVFGPEYDGDGAIPPANQLLSGL